MKLLNIVAFIIFALFGNAGSSNSQNSRNIRYPVDEQFSRDCQIESSGLGGVCKRFSECESAQNLWFGQRIYPTICYYHRSEAMICCVDKDISSSFTSFNIAGSNNPNRGQQDQSIVLGNGQRQQSNQNQFGPINVQINQANSDLTHLSLQDQPVRSNHNQATNEYKAPRRISQEKCDDVYDTKPVEYNQSNIYNRPSLVGGEPTEIDEYPFMAAIGWRGFDGYLEFKCGGFLVSRRFVITAAHCANLGGDKPVAVRPGGIDLKGVSGLDTPIQEIIVHPNYNDKETYNDIALIRLTKDTYNGIACLWQTNEIDKEYEEVKAIGYGHKEFGGPGSNSLLQIKLKLFDNTQCSPHYKPDSKFPNGIIDSQICSGDLTRKKDTCQGDSGGPIFIERNSRIAADTKIPVVIGITSFGQGCAGEAPSIYTRISAYLDWIEPIVWPN